MSQLIIEEGICIDEVENVLIAIRNLSGRNLDDCEIIKVFVNNEKHTKYYIDEMLNSYMIQDGSAIYLWIDTGFTDYKGNAIFVSLHRSYSGFSGHITGTASDLIRSMKNRHSKRKKRITENTSRFMNKYNSKVQERSIAHIGDIEEYYMSKCNEDAMGCDSQLAVELKKLNFVFEEDENENSVSEVVVEEHEEKLVWDYRNDDISDEDKDLTIALLLERIDSMQQEMSRMFQIIEENEKDKEVIKSLRESVESYKQTVVNIRLYNDQQNAEMKAREEARRNSEELNAHDLLGKNKKILIVGDCQLKKEEIQGICKEFGFNKKDMEYEIDYKRITNSGSRFLRSGKYDAVIFGKVPHKVAKMGDWSSMMEMMRQDEFGPYPVDARTKSGELNVTKTSFKEALMEICEYLRNQMDVAC